MCGPTILFIFSLKTCYPIHASSKRLIRRPSIHLNRLCTDKETLLTPRYITLHAPRLAMVCVRCNIGIYLPIYYKINYSLYRSDASVHENYLIIFICCKIYVYVLSQPCAYLSPVQVSLITDFASSHTFINSR